MKSADSDQVTFRQLQTLLAAMGFIRTKHDDGSIMYHHSRSGSVIVLPAGRGNQLARPADILSVGRHLIGQGHLEDDAFASFVRDGVLPESATT